MLLSPSVNHHQSPLPDSAWMSVSLLDALKASDIMTNCIYRRWVMVNKKTEFDQASSGVTGFMDAEL